jgi:hypothetical protein
LHALSGLECREVLALIQSDVDLKSIPTIVLGASDAASDILKCYDLKANCYMSKLEHAPRASRLAFSSLFLGGRA